MSTESSNNAVNVKCAIYARLATGDTVAIENQVRLCRTFIQTQPNWSVCEGYIFTDGPASGHSTTRLGLQSLLEAADAEPRPFDYLPVDETVRLGRSLDVVAWVLGLLSRIGIAVYCLSVGVVSMEEELFRVFRRGIAVLPHSND
jgi:DNA invertase Pin-like site-specific DNA recombinase